MDEGLLSVSKITLVVVAIFTLFFQFFPVARVRWAALPGEVKKRILVGVYILPGAVVAFGGCFPAFAEAVGLPLLCVGTSAFGNFIFGVLLAVGAGQGAFGLIPELEDVRLAKDARLE